MNQSLEGKKQAPCLMAILLAAAVLSACSSTQDVLEPSAITPPSASSATDPAASAPAGPSTTASSASTAATAQPRSAATVSAARIHFAPIVGTSIEAATSLSNRLASRTRERGIHMTGSSDPAATHLLKGYFTPLVEGKETTVIYVWDVYDPSGNRVHRISGQQKGASAGGEGWASVSPSIMQAIADQTVDQLAAWLGGSTG